MQVIRLVGDLTQGNGGPAPHQLLLGGLRAGGRPVVSVALCGHRGGAEFLANAVEIARAKTVFVIVGSEKTIELLEAEPRLAGVTLYIGMPEPEPDIPQVVRPHLFKRFFARKVTPD